MRFQTLSLGLLLSCSSTVHSFVPPHVKKAGCTQKPSFAATSRYASPLDNLPDVLQQVTLPSFDIDFVKDSLINSFQTVTDTLQVAIPAVALQEVLQQIAQDWNAAFAKFMATHPNLQPIYSDVQQQLQRVGLEFKASPLVVVAVSAIITYSILMALISVTEEPPPSEPYPDGKYNATSARIYFDRNPGRVIQRGLSVATNSVGFALGLLQDFITNKLEENADIRAMELTKLLTRLGPTFIKIGQSLSIRTDLLSPAYLRGLQTLQDRVPPFSSTVAKQMLEEEWGRPITDVVSYISPEPVAAASLGQVYKATLRETGQEVAIKVQRPNIMELVALDMYLLREAAPILKRTFNLNSDTIGAVDTWGIGFVDELDYIEEARNAESFTETIKMTALKDVVFAPPVIEELSTRKVLTTEWIDGERLDQSSSEDVTVLCSIAMNTYLTMMLETGLLHADPHPGNLLRTPDGRLCILDWGMVTRLDKDIQLTLIEHMAHLTSADYDEIPRDLLLLGFIPEEKADLIEDSGVVDVLADIYGAWTKGGGAAAINVNEVVAQLQDLTATRGNMFSVPAYFLLIAKAFSVLEGIGLTNDPSYSIINECLPYVSKRLLTDQSERAGGALSTFIFGADKANLDTRLVDYDRVEQLITGFGNYTTSTSGALLGKEALTQTQTLDQAADQILDLIFTEEETPLQTIFLEQLAKIVTASSRSIWAELRERSGRLPSGRTVLGTLVDPLGFWRTSPLVRMNEQDLRTVHTTQKLITLIQTQSQESQNTMFNLSNLSQEDALDLSRILVRKLWNRRSGLLMTGNRFATQLLKLTADKLERGERDTIVLAEPVREEPGPAVGATTRATSYESHAGKAPSARLLGARKLLAEIEQEDDAVFVVDVEPGVAVIEKVPEN